jgi:formylglycine-generating enzyme required for sulfatase activity
MPSAEPRWQRVTSAMAGRLDGVQIADLLWMAQLLAPEIPAQERAEPAQADQKEGPVGQNPSDLQPQSVDPAAAAGSSRAQQLPSSPTPSHQPSPPPPPAALVEPATDADPLPHHTPSVMVAEAGLLQRPRRIGRALAPLSRWIEDGPAHELDVPATVDAIAHARAVRSPWQPVLRPRREPWIHLHLVFDGHPTMALWQRLRRELPRTLVRQVRLGDLRCWQLGTSPTGAAELRGPHGRRCAFGALRRQSGRDLVLIVSDGIAPSWCDGSYARQLQRWAAEQPVVLLQVLPARLWPRTGLGQQEAGWVQARRVLQANPSLHWQPFEQDPFGLVPEHGPPPAGTFTLPVASLDPDDLAAMARLLGGPAGSYLRAVRFSPPPANAATAPPAPPTPEPDSQVIEQQLALFLFSASPQARRLLGLLTFAPVITLPLVRLIQRQQLAGSGPVQIAEVLFSGLFRNVAAAPAPGAPRVPADRQRLVFVDEALRGRLREGLRVGEARAVFDAVKAEVARSLNCSVDSFEALLKQPPPPGSVSDSEVLQAFATVAPSCLRGLGRRYEELADAIEKGWGPEEEDTHFDPPPPEIPLEPFTLDYETAWLEQIELQEISFKTSTLTKRGKRQDQEAKAWALIEPKGPQGLTLVQIPAGSFVMGSPSDELKRSNAEGPQHEVTLASFLMGQTPITQAQWREVASWQEQEDEHWGRKLNPNPSRFSDQADSDNRPVEKVSWFAAMEFCNRLSQRTGRSYTLPSEAQWEYACRAGTTTPFHFGTTITPELANYNGNWTYANDLKGVYREQTTPVASFPANAWGLHDMHGNVREWCLDHWHGIYEGAPSNGSAWLDPVKSEEEDNKKSRLLRGGSWDDNPRYCRSAYRNRLEPDRANINVGFRVVCLPQDPSLNA